MSKDFLSSVLGQIIVSNLTNVLKIRHKQYSTLWNQKKKNQMQYYYSRLPVEMQLGNSSSKARIG